jgi:hypothetical protein
VFRSPELHAGSTRLVEANRNRLLGRGCAMFSFSDVVHLFAHELSGLSTRRLALPLVATRTFQSFLLRHRSILPLRFLHTTMRQRSACMPWTKPITVASTPAVVTNSKQ